MPAIVVVGIQWGDEGKGKIVDVLSAEADYVVRHQGGNNAGHTVWIEGDKHILHLLPTGVIRRKKCVIGSGVVVDPKVLLQEIMQCKGKGIDLTPENLFLSPNCHIIFPYHIRIDTLREKRLGASAIGTTSRGIGPTYRDKIDRCGIRLGELADPGRFELALKTHLVMVNSFLTDFFKEAPFSFEEIYEPYREYGAALAPFLADVPGLLNQAAARGEKILFEGAQGTLLDVDAGTYPFVTSSNTASGGACTGSGFPPHRMDGCLGIVKAYTTRVGSGPFPTELHGEEADRLRNAGPAGEFGATTGRPRRCGWFDGPLVKRAVMLNGAQGLAVTRLDVLSEFDTIPMAVAYRYKGKTFDLAPEDLSILGECEVVYENQPGWRTDISGARTWEDLPRQAQDYLRKIEAITGSKVVLVSIGPNRDETIFQQKSIFGAFVAGL
ncbi:MAG: adenylosuccinate synthase [Candidatus Omnitrophica bacterium]|nr:adenylosuccinate synthase [bacterium]MCC6732973.1 adenylosuccinate synthase [Candidatus Omnitrophota bacterium]MCE7909217.1 adenylosuccinate synthase [Candidatus Omnitrophica bacterium COP1]MBV6480939.1 Adenylosuccinate synthetase [bacterium]MCK6495563.1 adenylosuccinate synthase [bacterium]